MSGENTAEIRVRDITLREGEQAAEVAFSSGEKAELGRLLAGAGVPVIQAGYGSNSDDREVVRSLKVEKLHSKVELLSAGFVSDWKKQLEMSAVCGVDILNYVFRTDDSHIADLGLTRGEAAERVEEITSFAESLGVKSVTFTASFSTQANPEFLDELIGKAVSKGVDEVVLADTTGIATPEAMGSLVARVKRTVDVRVGVHCHNDFGLALANTLAAMKAGATTVESSLGGFGERAGNTSTEELVVSSMLLYGHDLGINPKKIVDAAYYAHRASRLPVHPLRPIIGPNVFTQKLDLHVMTAKDKPWLHEPFSPDLVGRSRRLVLGKGSGPLAIREKARELAIDLPQDRVDVLVREVNKLAELEKRTLTDEEFRVMIGET